MDDNYIWKKFNQKLLRPRDGHRSAVQVQSDGSTVVIHIGGFGILPIEVWRLHQSEASFEIEETDMWVDDWFHYPEFYFIQRNDYL